MKTDLVLRKLETRAKDFNTGVLSMAQLYVIEQMAVRLAECEETSDFLLVNFFSIGPDRLHAKTKPVLKYVYDAGRGESSEKLTYILKRALKYNDDPIEWSWRSSKKDEVIYYHMDAKLGSLKLPFELELMRTEILPTPQTYHIRLILENSQYKDLKIYPADELIIEYIDRMMSKLLFFDEPELAMDCYELLTRSDLSGTIISKKMLVLSEKKGMRPNMEKLTLFSGLKSDAGMKKRFKEYVKRSGRDEITWDEAFSIIYAFIEPVWHEISRDRLYTGDWMGELGRYLD